MKMESHGVIANLRKSRLREVKEYLRNNFFDVAGIFIHEPVCDTACHMYVSMLVTWPWSFDEDSQDAEISRRQLRAMNYFSTKGIRLDIMDIHLENRPIRDFIGTEDSVIWVIKPEARGVDGDK